MKRTLMIVAFGAAVAAGPVYAHHSFAAHYLEDQTVSVEGDLVEFDYQNPHAWIHIAAPDNGGRMQRVSAEWSSPVRLKQQGIAKDTLKPGDRLIVTGSPSRDPSDYKLHVKRLERRPTDGSGWGGSTHVSGDCQSRAPHAVQGVPSATSSDGTA